MVIYRIVIIIDSFPRTVKPKRLIPVLLAPDRPKIRDDKTGTYTLLFYPIKLSVIRYDTGIFQYGLELIILKSEIIKKCYLV